MGEKQPDWKTYEQLAEKIYRKLEPESVVKHDDSIYGHESGANRQIDVSIRAKVGSHEILVIVQARDRKRSPNVNDVGEFASVVRDVRASKGVMICRKQPSKNAANLAASSNIEMCSAFDVNDRKWREDVVVPVVVTLHEGEMVPYFGLVNENVPQFVLPPPGPGLVSTDGGTTGLHLFKYMIDYFVSRGNVSPGRHKFVSEDRGLFLFMCGNWVPVPLFAMEVCISSRRLFRHCKANEYLALMNYSTGVLSVAEIKVELPPFNDSAAWQDGDNVNLPEEMIEDVPVVDLKFPMRLYSEGMRFSLLTRDKIEEERERLLNEQ